MKKNLNLLLLTPLFLLSLGCESNNQSAQKIWNDERDRASMDSGFVKFDPSAMDSNPQKRKKITHVISGKESLRDIKNND